MKKVFLLFSLVVCNVAHAQPPAQSEVAPNPPNTNAGVPVKPIENENDERARVIKWASAWGPTTVVHKFIAAASFGRWQEAGDFLAGADVEKQVWKDLGKMPLREQPRVIWKLKHEEGAKDRDKELAGKLSAEIDVQVGTVDEYGVQIWKSERISLRREDLTWKAGLQTPEGKAPIWRIVAPSVETLKAQTQLSIVGYYAWMLSHPEQFLQAQMLNKSASQLKQLVLGIHQFLVKSDEKYDFDTTNWREKIMPYVKSKELFTAPEDAEGTTSYSFNPNLAGKVIQVVRDPARTVLLYLGKDEKLDFRFEGKATVAFADGHVEMVGPDKKLNWNP